MLLHDSVTDREAEARAFARSLGRKKWIVDLVNVFAADSDAGVLNENLDFRIHRVRQDADNARLANAARGMTTCSGGAL